MSIVFIAFSSRMQNKSTLVQIFASYFCGLLSFGCVLFRYYCKNWGRLDKQVWTWHVPGLQQKYSIRYYDVIKRKHFPCYWPFMRGNHRSPVNSPHKGQWRGALMFSLICSWINHWVNSDEAGDLRRYRNHYDVTVMGIHYVLICNCYHHTFRVWFDESQVV